MSSDSVTVIISAIAAFVVVVALVLGYKLVRRNPRVGRTRLGVFIERDYENDDDEVTRQWPGSSND